MCNSLLLVWLGFFNFSLFLSKDILATSFFFQRDYMCSYFIKIAGFCFFYTKLNANVRRDSMLLFLDGLYVEEYWLGEMCFQFSFSNIPVMLRFTH